MNAFRFSCFTAILLLAHCAPIGNLARDGNWNQVRKEVSQGANPDRTDDEGLTALYHAAKAGNIEIARFLIEQGADPDARDERGNNLILFAAITTQNASLVRLLIQAGADPRSRLPEDGAPPDPPYIPLDYAVKSAPKNDAEIVAILVDGGADVNFAELWVDPPIQEAAYWNKPRVIEVLIEKGSRIDGTGALEAAIKKDRAESINVLLKHGASLPTGYPLEENLATIARLADPRILAGRGKDDQNALLFAAVAKQSKTGIENMLAAGASPAARDPEGNTLILRLIEWGGQTKNKHETLRFLLKAGAPAFGENKAGGSALSEAMTMGPYGVDSNNQNPYLLDARARIALLLPALRGKWRRLSANERALYAIVKNDARLLDSTLTSDNQLKANGILGTRASTYAATLGSHLLAVLDRHQIPVRFHSRVFGKNCLSLAEDYGGNGMELGPLTAAATAGRTDSIRFLLPHTDFPHKHCYGTHTTAAYWIAGLKKNRPMQEVLLRFLKKHKLPTEMEEL